MSATVPDDMWLRPWRLRPTPRTVPFPSSPISKTRALANSVPMSSAVQAASDSPSSRCQSLRRNATSDDSRAGQPAADHVEPDPDEIDDAEQAEQLEPVE